MKTSKITRSLKIGNIVLKNPLILAPLVDVTNLPYRMICRKAGASLAYIEMIYADAITHENKKTKELMRTIKTEHPLGIQITGNNVKEIKDCIPYLKG
ncbi:MAG TPA: tRNA-dihydrouridine synthase, partial [Candidatus Nanoarchaeia archaeon]|nr:tRNA-dihydrouridine synthase [Candidatus Nanoarchaeia archaeon]